MTILKGHITNKVEIEKSLGIQTHDLLILGLVIYNFATATGPSQIITHFVHRYFLQLIIANVGK